MLLFVGLGNPGKEHARQRHNIGFLALDRIAEDHGFAPWRSKFQGELSDGRLGGEKVLLLKPSTYMNLSGGSVAAAARFHKIPVEDITVFHDELDLAPAKCRVKRGGGHAGHNGLRDIHRHMGPDYQRVRLGIGHPGDKNRVSGYVLHDFARQEERWLEDLLAGIADGAPKLAAGDEGGFMNAVALRLTPPKPKRSKAAKPDGATAAGAADAPGGMADTPGGTAPDAAKGNGDAASPLSPFEALRRRFT